MATIKHEIDNSAAVQAEQRYRREKEKSNKALEDEVKAAKIADRETQRFLKRSQTEQQKWTAAQAKAQELKRREPRLVKEIEASLERQRRAIFGVDRAEKMRAQAAAESAKRELAERRKLIAAANEQKAAQEKLLDQGRRITQDLETPTERYKRKVLELGRAYRSGSISKETFIRGTRKLKADLAAATTQAQAAGAATRGAFGGSAVQQLGSYAAGVFSIATATSAVVQGFRDVEQAAQSSADAAFAAIADQGELQQLSPDTLAANNAFAKELIRRGVFSPAERGAAFRTSFSLESAEFSDAEKNFIADVGQTRFVKPESLVEFGGRLRKTQNIFGADDTGSLEQTLDKVVAAASTTQSDASTIARAIPSFATEAKALGIQFEEAVSAFVEIEKESESPEIAATRFRGLLSRFDKSGLTVNSDLTESLDAIQKRVDAGERLVDIAPDVRARSGLRTLLRARQAGGIEAGELRIENSDDAFRRQSKRLQSIDPVFAAGLGRAEQEGQLANSRETSGDTERELLFDITTAARIEAARAQQGALGEALTKISVALQDLLGFEDFILRNLADNAEARLTPGNQERLESYLERQAVAAERTAAAVEGSPSLTRGRME